MSPAERATLPDIPAENVEDGVSPPWRCQACVKNDKYAVQRVVDVVRAENGQVFLLMEYLGYPYLEARPNTWLEDKKAELRLAYKEHATVRPNHDMLYCGGALLDAMRSGQDLKALGLETKLVPREKGLYLISHASLEKRGLSRGAANAFQMLHGSEHRLVFPFALKNLQCTVDGKYLSSLHGLMKPTLKRGLDTTTEPSLQLMATHLAELTANPASLPVALASALAGEGAWEGLGLLSGSSINDIVAALTEFCTHYGPGNWAALLRQELPGLTDDDITWLCGLSEEMEQFEPRYTPVLPSLAEADRHELTLETGSKRPRRSTTTDVQVTGAIHMEATEPHPADQSATQRSKRERTTQCLSLPTRRSARLTPTPPDTDGAASVSDRGMEAPHTHLPTTPREKRVKRDLAAEQPPPPSPLAASQRQFRPKLSRAQRILYGASHRFGLLSYLQILITYLQCIGEQYSATGQSRVIYFRTDDMLSTRDWKDIPTALDIRQPTIPFKHAHVLDQLEGSEAVSLRPMLVLLGDLRH
jgi:hypothetical protein